MIKRFKNFKESPVTTVMGVITLVLAVLVPMGVITPEVSQGLEAYLGEIVAGVAGIIFMFSKDDKKKDVEGK